MLHMEQIGVRELRLNASAYLRRVVAGESIEITDRKRPVARLVPIVEDPYEQMVESGELAPAARPGGMLNVEPLPAGDGAALSEVLAEMRRDER